MKTRDTLAALLAIFVISPWSSCGNLPADKTAESAYRLTYYPNGANSGKAPVDGESYAEGDPVTVQGNAGGACEGGLHFLRMEPKGRRNRDDLHSGADLHHGEVGRRALREVDGEPDFHGELSWKRRDGRHGAGQ